MQRCDSVTESAAVAELSVCLRVWAKILLSYGTGAEPPRHVIYAARPNSSQQRKYTHFIYQVKRQITSLKTITSILLTCLLLRLRLSKLRQINLCAPRKLMCNNIMIIYKSFGRFLKEKFVYYPLHS